MHSGKSLRLAYWFSVYTALLRMLGVIRPKSFDIIHTNRQNRFNVVKGKTTFAKS